MPFSVDACLELFESLPEDIIDDIRNFAADPSSFVEDEDPEDVAAQAGN